MLFENFFEERSSRVQLPGEGTVRYPDGWYILTSEGGSSYASTSPGTINPAANRMVVCRDEEKRIFVPAGRDLYCAAGLGAILTVTRVVKPAKVQ